MERSQILKESNGKYPVMYPLLLYNISGGRCSICSSVDHIEPFVASMSVGYANDLMLHKKTMMSLKLLEMLPRKKLKIYFMASN